MKRFIDLLTIITTILTILATSWSIQSFGQTRVDDSTITIVLDEEPLAFQTTSPVIWESSRISAEPKSSSATPAETNCKQFEFLGDPYFSNPSDYYADSCTTTKTTRAGYFQFMGDYYPDLPEEKVHLQFIY